MTPNSSVYRLNSISEYSRALESVRVVSRAVSLVEQGKVVDNFSVYEEAFQNLSQSLAAAKARGSMTPQLQQASAKLEGLLEKLSKRVEAASARVKEASSASFGARVIGWASAPKEQILGAAKTAGNAGQWAWSHKKTVAGGVIVGSAIYNDAFGSFRTAASACTTFWKILTGVPAFINQFASQTEKVVEEVKEGAGNAKELVEDVTLPAGVTQELLRKNIEKCRNAESGQECVDFVVGNFEAMQQCMPSANEPFDLKRWFWCVDNKLSGTNSSSFEQFEDERTSQVARTALSLYGQVLLARAMGIKMPGGEFFNNYVAPWILPNVMISSVYPEYITDVKTYCASHPVLCATAGVAAFLKGGPVGGGVLAAGTFLNYIDQEFLDGGINNATQRLVSHPDEVIGNLTETGKQIRDELVDELVEDSDLSFPLAAALPTAWSVGSQVLGWIGTVPAAAIATDEGRLQVMQERLAELEEEQVVVNGMVAQNLAAVGAIAARRRQMREVIGPLQGRIQALQQTIANAQMPKTNPSFLALSLLTLVGFGAPKIPKAWDAISSTASNSNMTLSDVSGYVMEKTPTLIVPQSMIDNRGTMITTVAIGILPQLAMFFVRRFV